MLKPDLLLCFFFILFSCSEAKTDQNNNDAAEREEMMFQSALELLEQTKSYQISIESRAKEIDPKNNVPNYNSFLHQLKSIDLKTENIIREIDNLKLDLLRRNGENITFDSTHIGKESYIIWSEFDPKNPLLPIHLNLQLISPSKYSENSDLELLDNNFKPAAKGISLWNLLINYRRDLINLTGTYKNGNQTFKVKTTPINKYQNKDDLLKNVRKMLGKNKANFTKDEVLLTRLYISLTKFENDKKGNHWLTNTFGNLPLVYIINNLTFLQNEILLARSLAFAHIESKVNYSGSYGTGYSLSIPKDPKPGEVEIELSLKNMDFYPNPVFTTNRGIIIRVKSGVPTIALTIDPNKTFVLKGTASYRLANGELEVMPWNVELNINEDFWLNSIK